MCRTKCGPASFGYALMARVELFAIRKGFRTIALRAANPKLIRLYRRAPWNFRRAPNACHRRRRGDVIKMRELDWAASAWFTSRLDEATGHWDDAGQKKDWENSGLGWWMSKCLESKANKKHLVAYAKRKGLHKELREAGLVE